MQRLEIRTLTLAQKLKLRMIKSRQSQIKISYLEPEQIYYN